MIQRQTCVERFSLQIQSIASMCQRINASDAVLLVLFKYIVLFRCLFFTLTDCKLTDLIQKDIPAVLPCKINGKSGDIISAGYHVNVSKGFIYRCIIPSHLVWTPDIVFYMFFFFLGVL